MDSDNETSYYVTYQALLYLVCPCVNYTRVRVKVRVRVNVKG